MLPPTPGPTPTLVTCHPFFVLGHASKRFIVHAVRVEAGALGANAPQRVTRPVRAAAVDGPGLQRWIDEHPKEFDRARALDGRGARVELFLQTP